MEHESIIDTIARVHALDRVPRAGYLLRGIADPESVAAHSHALALLTLLVCRKTPGRFDEATALSMALIHDLPEVETMDIPMPAGSDAFRGAKQETESEIAASILSNEPTVLDEYRDYARGESAEARLVKGLDKVQMMIKVFCYGREGRGILDDFWNNPANFRDYGIDIVAELFSEIAIRAGRSIPTDS